MVLQLNNALRNLKVSVLHRSSGSRISLLEPLGTSVVEKITYRSNILIPYTTLTVTIRKPANLDLFGNGDLIWLEGLIHNTETIYTHDIINQFLIGEVAYTDNPLEMITYTCRDFMTFASTSEYSEKMDKNEVASEFIRRTAVKYGFQINSLEDTDTPLETHLFDNSTLYKMWITALTLEMNRTKRLYRLFMKHNGLVLESFTSRQRGWIFEAQTARGNIVVSDRKVSIFDKRFSNSVVGYVPAQQNQGELDGSLSAITSSPQNIHVTDSDSISRFGLVQKRININNMQESDALTAAETLFQPEQLDEIQLSTLPFFGVKLYDIVYVVNHAINAMGQYFVNEIQMEITGGAGNMRLSLSKIRNIPRETLTQLKSGNEFDLSGLVN